jgi:hypothetical protein
LLIEHLYSNVPQYALKVVTFQLPDAEAWIEARLAEKKDKPVTPKRAVKEYLGIVGGQRKKDFGYLRLEKYLVRTAQRIKRRLSKQQKRATSKKGGLTSHV